MEIHAAEGTLVSCVKNYLYFYLYLFLSSHKKKFPEINCCRTEQDLGEQVSEAKPQALPEPHP